MPTLSFGIPAQFTPVLTVSPTSYNFTNHGGVIQIDVSTDERNEWYAYTFYSWLTINPSEGTGSGHFHVTASQQTSGSDSRSTQIGISSSAIIGNAINISQDASIITSCTIDPTSLTFAGNGDPCSTSTINVTSNTSWTVSYSQSWVHGTNSGSGDNTIDFTVDNNEGLNRSATITVSASGVPNRTCSISQAASGNPCT